MTTLPRALIGHTGFVGSTLVRSAEFTKCFNSQNSSDMIGQSFGQVVCAGVNAQKWVANADPAADWQRIERLLQAIDRIECEEFILISTIDVYPNPSAAADESERIDGAVNHAYGAHRLQVEEWAARRFGNCRIVRLPALFGSGLKKNILYDLLHDNQLQKINPLSEYQWYPLARLWTDIERTRTLDLRLVNLFPEPLLTERIVERCFPGARVGEPRRPAPAYRVRTRYAELFGGQDGYLCTAAAVLDAIENFVRTARSSAA